MISRDRGLMARTYGSIFIFGATVASVGLLFGRATEDQDWVILVLAAIAISLGLVCFIGYRRLPVLFFQLLTLVGTALITIGATAAPEGAEGVYAIFYVWMAILAGMFFSVPVAAMLIAVPPIALGAVLYERGIPSALNYAVTLAAVLGTSALIIGLLRGRIERLAVTLASEAHTDSLTELPNRRAFDERFELESERAARSGEPMSVAICDLDRFKSVNDLLGHQGGDEALRRASAAIDGALRAGDAVARMGGDEFGLVLPNSDRDEAHQVGERVRLAVVEEFADGGFTLTTSCGIATLGRDGEGRRLLQAADLALYRAKELGRNRTVSFGEEDDPIAQSVPESSTK